MRVIFSPHPQDADINKILSEPNIDLSKYGYKQTQIFDKIFELPAWIFLFYNVQTWKLK